MYYLSVLFLTFLLLCYGDGQRNLEGSGSMTLILPIGRDHVVMGSFGLYSALATFVKEDYMKIYIELRDQLLVSEPKVELRLSNFIFINNDFKLTPRYSDVFTTQFRGQISSHDFDDSTKTSDDVNEIIAKEAKTSRIFRPEDFTDTTMILANVFEFKAPWTYPFEESDTKDESLPDVRGGHRITVMKKKLQVPFTSIETIKANVMELSLGNTGKYSLLLIKPHLGVHVTKTFELLKEITLNNILDTLQRDLITFGLQDINVTLPRCKIISSFDLTRSLSDMGMVEAFNSDDGHFPGISDDQIEILSVEHQAHITFTEKGVHAVALTPGPSSDSGTYSPDSETAHPFIFFLLEKSTRTVLFDGLHSRTFNFNFMTIYQRDPN